MTVTDVRIHLASDRDSNERIKAYATIIFDDCLAVHDTKLIKTPIGLVVCMPSRRKTTRCDCGTKCPIGQRYCGDCGTFLPDAGPIPSGDRRSLMYADIVHPLNAAARCAIERAVIAAYHAELIHAGEGMVTA